MRRSSFRRVLAGVAVLALLLTGSLHARDSALVLQRGSFPTTATTTKAEAGVIKVAIARAFCSVSPRSTVAGATDFRIANRSGQAARFAVAGRTVAVARGRTSRLSVSLREGRVRYACTVAGRRVGAGQITVITPLEEHRIGIRMVNGSGEFYDRATGAKFVPRGHEYVRLGPQKDTGGNTFVYFTTFNVGRYDAARSEAVLARMAADGYNTVTVGINALCAVECAADPVGGRLRPAYFANLVDFLRKAKAHGIQVMLGTQFVIGPTVYSNLITAHSQVDNVNLIPLTRGGIDAYSTFWTDVVRELRRQGAPFDTILAYQLFDELAYVSNAPPFTLSSGTLRAPNGRTYDLASADDRRRLMDDGIVYWIDEIRAAIRKVDPTGLVTVGFFEPQEPNPSRSGDIRILSTRGAIERSTADFIAIHPYPGGELSLTQYMQNFGIDRDLPKPIVIGEYGAFKFAYPSPVAAVPALLAWQRESCRYGVDGWLLWTWDTDEQPELWNATSEGGVIEQALAPKNRPDPCA